MVSYEFDGHKMVPHDQFVALKPQRFGDWMQSYTGRAVYPLDPRADEFLIDDIAHALSMQCRYAGHCLRFYSVGEHSVHIARWLLAQGHDNGVALKGLLHDATEAYLVDVPRPVKPFLEGYKPAEARLWAAICAWMGISSAMPREVHEADNRILNDELAQNMAPPPQPWADFGEPLGITLEFWDPERAEQEFLAMFARLTEVL